MKKRTNILAGVFGTAVAAALFGAAAFFAAVPAKADIASPSCDGNICSGSIVVGGQTVEYEYTEHVDPNGEFRIRLNGGTYNTSQLISFIVYDVPRFKNWNKFANPSGGAVFLPQEDVNPGRTAYERRDANGCSGCVVDQVMTLGYQTLAAGTYSFSLTIIQNGATGGAVDIPFYVDAAAPSNTNESDEWTTLPRPAGTDFPCADNVDNDLDYYGDCADSQCTGEVGRVADNALCEAPETTCYDGFDNNANGKTDCLDPQCDGLVGRQTPVAYCQLDNEKGASSCNDTFDNDADGFLDCLDNVSVPPGNPANSCWKQGAYGCPAIENCSTGFDDDNDQAFGQGYDNQPTTGVNCQDYDCAGDAACPADESKTAGGADADEQCFDGLDNDLDGPIDCADVNCKGVVNPNDLSETCLDKEFDLGQRYQYCANSFDDDGDAAADCADSDCSRQFGSCGPCPDREDYRYNSCADGSDNDSDGPQDCSDSDCTGGAYPKLGALANAALCSAAESGGDMCGDSLDNDADGLADCAEASCAGTTRCEDNSCAYTYACQGTEAACGDGQDNDADGTRDCADSDCFGVGACAAQSWASAASCQEVPRFSPLRTFTSTNPTVSVQSYEATRVSTTDVVRFVGDVAPGQTYTSITIIIGDNTDPSRYYPYASSTDCVLAGAGAASLDFRVVPGHAVQVYNRTGQTLGDFDVTLTCDTPAAPAAERTYPVSISVLKQPNDVPEYGDADFTTTLYESTPPTTSEVEGEGEVVLGGTPTLVVRYGDSRRFRAIPNDPGSGLDQSGICKCTVTVDGDDYDSAGGECVTPALSFVSDFLAPQLSVDANAEDGAGNIGSPSSSQLYDVNVIPAVTDELAVTSPSRPFFKAGAMDVGVFAEFTTATASTFAANCEAFLYTNTGTPVGPGAFATMPGQTLGNFTRCQSTVTLPSVADGEYFLTVRATDDQGDAAETIRRPVYVCNSVPAFGAPETVCSKADFDGDDATEGLYTTVFTTAPKACDNCVNLANSQTDANANGVGDVCEPPDLYGRCEIDRDIVCQCDSDADPSCLGPRCPAPSILPPNISPQACRMPWGLCTLGGEVCFEDSECPGGQGLCSGDNLTACYRDQDCEDVGGACIGADRCEDLLFPWLQATQGNVFSKKKISAPELPPEGLHNATFCVTAAGTILNFTSELCGATSEPTTRYERPKPENFYRTVLGKVDLAGLEAGKYGTVVNVTPAQFETIFNSNPLAGKVYVVDSPGTEDLVISNTITVSNAAGAAKGNGTVLVKDRNLRINANIQYDSAPITSTSQLASIGWLVVPDSGGSGGNIYIDKDVTELAGAFFSGGDDGFYSVAPPESDSPQPLTVSGLAVARRFYFSRSYKSRTRGSELFNFDGRAVANPPPGFEDVSTSLPVFGETPVQ